jgi:hypothetical protein
VGDGGVAVVSDVAFASPSEAPPGGAEFQSCYGRAVIGSQILCVDCKEGTVSVTHPVAMSFQPPDRLRRLKASGTAGPAKRLLNER